MHHRQDVAPPGREEQVKALKTKPGIDNPFAVAWASYNGDDMEEECDDGVSGATAGAKPGNDNPDLYEKGTLGDVPFKHGENDMYDDDEDLIDDSLDLHQHAGHPVGAVHSMHGAAGTASQGNTDPDEDALLDDSEVSPGEHIPGGLPPMKDPKAKAPQPSGISDPDPIE